MSLKAILESHPIKKLNEIIKEIKTEVIDGKLSLSKAKKRHSKATLIEHILALDKMGLLKNRPTMYEKPVRAKKVKAAPAKAAPAKSAGAIEATVSKGTTKKFKPVSDYVKKANEAALKAQNKEKVKNEKTQIEVKKLISMAIKLLKDKPKQKDILDNIKASNNPAYIKSLLAKIKAEESKPKVEDKPKKKRKFIVKTPENPIIVVDEEKAKKAGIKIDESKAAKAGIKLIKKKETEPDYTEISIKGDIFFYKQKGKKDIEILNENGNVPSKNMIEMVKKYISNKTFKKKIDNEYKKELDVSIKKTNEKDKKSKIEKLIPGINVNKDKNLKPLKKEFIPNTNNLKDMKKYKKILNEKLKNKKMTKLEHESIIKDVNKQIEKLIKKTAPKKK